jgi:hypothetical protein
VARKLQPKAHQLNPLPVLRQAVELQHLLRVLRQARALHHPHLEDMLHRALQLQHPHPLLQHPHLQLQHPHPLLQHPHPLWPQAQLQPQFHTLHPVPLP